MNGWNGQQCLMDFNTMAVSLMWTCRQFFSEENNMIITDEIMVTNYKVAVKSLATLVRSREDAFLIFWFDIAMIVKASNVTQKKDFYCKLMNDMTGINRLGNEIYDTLEKESDLYSDIMKKYRYGKYANELGFYWRELICDEKIFRLRILASYLNKYQKVFVPYIRKKMKDWVSIEETQNSSSILAEENKKEWNVYKEGIQYTQNIAKIACDIFGLQCNDR